MTATKIRTVIVDDELLARESLKLALQEFAEVEILRECAHGFDAVKAVQELKPDLLFLDIQMPKLDGFDVVELLGKDAPIVVFVTAYDEYALKAFDAQALDYLLKPVTSERLEKTIQKIKSMIHTPENSQPQKEKLVESHQDEKVPIARILVRDGSNVFIVPTRKITHIEAQDDYVCIYTEKESYLKNERLSRLEKLLGADTFCRIHRSFLLNINFLRKIEPHTKDTKLAILNDGKQLSISRSGYNLLKKLL